LQWQLSEHGIFCAKAFKPKLHSTVARHQAVAAKKWTTGSLQGQLTHEVSWFSKGADVPAVGTTCFFTEQAFDGQQIGLEVLFYLKRVA
jgi:hypothetical protein